MRRYVFSPVVDIYSSKYDNKYFQENPLYCDQQTGLVTGLQVPQVQSYAPPDPTTTPHPPSHTSHYSCRENSRGQQGHHARCAKSWQQTGPGSKSFRGEGMRAAWKKKKHPWLLSSDVLILCFSNFHCLIGNLLTFPSCNLIIGLPFHKLPLAHLSYFSIHLKTEWLSGCWLAYESV